MVLNECKTRVDAIALIHEKLYQSRDFTNIPFAAYARALVTTIFQAVGLPFGRITTEISIDDITLPVAQAIPCGLIINELVTNAIKHAFPGQRAGTLAVRLTQVEAQLLRLEVADDGVGMAEFSETAERDSIGLHLVVSLVDQLNGQLQIATDNGVAVRVDFPSTAVIQERRKPT